MNNDILPSVLDRLYTKDLEKRKQKKEILTKIYTPMFTPFLYTKGIKKQHLKKVENSNKPHTNRNHFNNIKNFITIDENHDDENDYNEDNSEKYYSEKKRKVKLIKIKK